MLLRAADVELIGAREENVAPPLRDYNPRLKRFIDLVVASLALVALSPLILAIVIAIKLESRGPAIFCQERVGLRGRRFCLYKFRSMTTDAEARLEDIRALNEMDGPVFKLRSDPRVTKVGRFLRRTSMDELPQLVNVLKGEMSLVGPRPPLPAEVAQYTASQMVRLTVLPGLTCLWQVSGRSDISFERWMELDRQYIRQMSLLLDLRILLRTVLVVLRGVGAY